MAYDDDELPDNLFDAVATAAEATEQAISAGSLGNLVELRIPELWDPISGNVMAEAGDQLKVWEITQSTSPSSANASDPTSASRRSSPTPVAPLSSRRGGRTPLRHRLLQRP